MTTSENTPAQRIADEVDQAIADMKTGSASMEVRRIDRPAPPPLNADIRDAAMRNLWLASGGTFHDVYQARGYMPQRRLLDFLWRLVSSPTQTVAIRSGEIVLEAVDSPDATTSGFPPANGEPRPPEDGVDPTPTPPPPNGDAGPHPTPPHAPVRGKPGPKPKSK